MFKRVEFLGLAIMLGSAILLLSDAVVSADPNCKCRTQSVTCQYCFELYGGEHGWQSCPSDGQLIWGCVPLAGENVECRMNDQVDCGLNEHSCYTYDDEECEELDAWVIGFVKLSAAEGSPNDNCY